MIQEGNLWKGLVSYTEEDVIEGSYIFSGRRDITLALLSMVKNNLLVTLYGKSGIGKTSMLQAGLFPLLRRDNYLPILLRPAEIDYDNFDAYVIETVKDQLEKHNVTRYVAGKDGRFNQKTDNDTDDSVGNIALWFASSKFYDSDNREVFPVLVFDQFEALFIGSRDKGSEVLRGLHTMIDDSELQCPEDVVCHNEANFRIMLVVREDDLFRLEDAIDELSCRSMKDNRLRLRALTDAQAREVIEKPVDELKGKTGFSLIPDDEREEVIKRIIDISRNRSGKVDSAILSLVCRELYSLANGGVITSRLVGQIDKNPLGRFYSKAIRGLKDEERLYIESLVDNRGRRRTVFRSNINKYIKEPDKLFNGENKLLQNVPGTKPADGDPENQPVELVHDLLAKAVAESKGRRRKINSYRSRKASLASLSIILFCTVFAIIGAQVNLKSYLTGEEKSVDGYEVLYLGKTRFNNPLHDTYKNRADIDSIYINLDSIYKTSTHVSIKNCASLKKIRFAPTPSDSVSNLYITVTDCPALTEIVLPDSLIRRINLRISGSPNIAPIKIARDVEFLTARINFNSLYSYLSNNALQIDKRNEVYKYNQGVLWDVKRHKADFVGDSILYAAFPDEMVQLDSIQTGFRPQTVLSIFSRRGPASPSATIYNIRIKNADIQEISKAIIAYANDKYLEKFADPYYSGTVDLKDRPIETIGFNAFEKSQVSGVILPDSLHTIDDRAFSNAPNLTDIYLPDGVRYVGEYAFADCKNLKEVSVNKNTYIHRTAFAGSPDVVLKVRDDDGHERIFKRDEPLWPWKPVRNSDYINNVIFDLYSSFDNNGLYVPESGKFDIKGGYLGEHDYIGYSPYGNDSTYINFNERAIKFRGNKFVILHDIQFCTPKSGERKAYILPERNDFRGVQFTSLPVDVREIYLPFKNPYFIEPDSFGDEILANRKYGFIAIPDSLKQRIILNVPSGSAPVYKTIGEYQGFKAIKELSAFDLAEIKVSYYTDMPALLAKNGHSLLSGIIALLLVFAAVVAVAYYPATKMAKEVHPKHRWRFWVTEILSVVVIMTTVFPLMYLGSVLIFDSSITSGVIKGLIVMFAALIAGFYTGLPRGERLPPWLKRRGRHLLKNT